MSSFVQPIVQTPQIVTNHFYYKILIPNSKYALKLDNGWATKFLLICLVDFIFSKKEQLHSLTDFLPAV